VGALGACRAGPVRLDRFRAIPIPPLGRWAWTHACRELVEARLFNSSRGSIAAVALFHGALDIFINSPVAAGVPNVMGAVLTIGTLLVIPVFGPEDLAKTPRVFERD
jgi:hypothetical protein